MVPNPQRGDTFISGTKCVTPLWVFLTFLKLCRWYQVAKSHIFLKPNFTRLPHPVVFGTNATRKGFSINFPMPILC